MRKEILVIERKKLFKEDYFEGFIGEGKFNSRILKNFEYIERDKAENNPNYKQPIAYSLIMNPSLRKVFAFQRAKKDKDYGEKRLQGKWSWGIGGHIEKVDSINPILDSMTRELSEEADFNPTGYSILGYINDDSNPVGKVHFGILYLIKTDSKEVKTKDSEVANGKLRALNELEKIVQNKNVETWSQIALEPLKKYLKS